MAPNQAWSKSIICHPTESFWYNRFSASLACTVAEPLRAISPQSFTLELSGSMTAHLPVSNTPQLWGLLCSLFLLPVSNVLSPCAALKWRLCWRTGSAAEWNSVFMEPSLCLNQSWLLQKLGWTHSALNRVGVPIKILSGKHNIPITPCWFETWQWLYLGVNSTWHFKHVITPFRASVTHKASVTMSFIWHHEYIIGCQAKSPHSSNHCFTHLYTYIQGMLPITRWILFACCWLGFNKGHIWMICCCLLLFVLQSHSVHWHTLIKVYLSWCI